MEKLKHVTLSAGGSMKAIVTGGALLVASIIMLGLAYVVVHSPVRQVRIARSCPYSRVVGADDNRHIDYVA